MTSKKIFLPFFFTFLFSFFTNFCLAKDQKVIDSLHNELIKFDAHKKELGSKATSLMDSTRANIYYELFKAWSSKPDSGLFYIEQVKSLSERMGYRKGMGNYYNGLGLFYMGDARNYLFSEECYQKAIKIRNEIGDKEGLAWTFNNMGMMYGDKGNILESIKSHSKAIKAREEIGDKVGMSESYKKRGYQFINIGNYPEALKDFFNALKVAEEANYNESIESSYECLGIIYEKEGNYKEALKNYISASKFCEKTGNRFRVTAYYDNFGKIYLYQGDTTTALKMFEEELNFVPDFNLNNIVMFCNSEIGDINFYQGKYDEALKHYLTSLKVAKEKNEVHFITKIHIQIARVYVKEGRYLEALSYLKNPLIYSQETGYKESVRDVYQLLSEIYSKQNNYKAAYDYQILYHQLKDTILNVENTNKIKQLDMQFAYDKDAAIQKAEQDKKDREVEVQKLRRNATIIGMIFIVIILVLIILLRTRIARERRQKALDQERTRISKDLHDDLGSELSKISLLSDIVNLNTNADDMKPHLENISRSSKAMVENMGDIIWIMNAKNDQLPNLVSYTRKYAMEFFDTTPIRCQVIQPDTNPAIQIIGDVRRNIFLVVKEALNNILKHSEADKVEIVFAINAHSFSINIHDNGKGIDPSKLSEFGNGLVNMEKRMRDIGGKFSIKNQEGTVVEISIPV
jgi:two-component system sensor histidine kinase UhpB